MMVYVPCASDVWVYLDAFINNRVVDSNYSLGAFILFKVPDILRVIVCHKKTHNTHSIKLNIDLIAGIFIIYFL